MRVPSLISPPEPGSASLPDPAAARLRFGTASELAALRIVGFLIGTPAVLASDTAPAGERERRELPLGVLAPVARRECDFFCFLRDDSLPLRSEALAEPLRLSAFFSGCLLARFDGVFCFDDGADPVAAAAATPEPALAPLAAASSASFLACSSRSRSSSVSVESVCE